MRIYISGKITGLNTAECGENFRQAEEMIDALGHESINPLRLEHKDATNWAEYMRTDIKALMDCDAVFALKNYADSKGALIEVKLARVLKMPVFLNRLEIPRNLFKYETPVADTLVKSVVNSNEAVVVIANAFKEMNND